MKKIYGILFLALLSLLVIFTLSACGSEDDSTDSTVEKCLDDEHEYYAWETIVEAFCNTQGVRQRSCGICGHTQQQRFTNSTNHVYENNI